MSSRHVASNPKEAQRRLMKKYHIIFEGPIDSTNQSKWPIHCRTILQHLRQLGKTEFESYREAVSADMPRHPWREQARRRARRIVSLAKLCLEGRKNESGWRLSLESEIMARFTVEVACRRCRGRLWRSEQEVAPGRQDSLRPKSLRERQMRRIPCSCVPVGSQVGIHDEGISPIFDDRADEAMVYPPAIMSEMPKREERPDRVYGLRRTKRLERLLLWTEGKCSSAESKLIGDNLKTSPFRPDGEPIIFPFLIIEAKSEKGADAFTDIEVQTAFAIRELLSMQNDLRNATEENTDWDAGPLVWFVAYKGEQWRVSVACIDTAGKDPCYRVFRVWSGGVDSLDAALQILLIVDYIVDWARDIYREAIIQSLRKLAATDSRSLAYDSDILSLAGKSQVWKIGADEPVDPGRTEPEADIHDVLRDLDSPHGVLRDARYIRSRFISLYITEDNFSVLMESTPSPDESRKLARSILDILKEAWRVTREALDGLEAEWTSTDRDGSDLYPPDKKFLAVFTASAYLTPDWELTREVSFLAVAETLLDSLLDNAGLVRRPEEGLDVFPLVPTDKILGFRSLFQTTAAQNLTVAASRACLVSGRSPISAGKKDTDDCCRVLVSEQTVDGIKVLMDVVIKPAALSKARELVCSIYDRHKIGRNEPSSSIFRASSRLDELGLPRQVSERPEVRSSPAFWPQTFSPDNPVISGLDGHSVVFAASGDQPGSAVKLCLFILDPAIFKEDLWSKDLLRAGPEWYFNIKTLERRPRRSRGWNVRDPTSHDRQSLMPSIDKLFDHLQTVGGNIPSDIAGLGSSHQDRRAWGPKQAGTHWTMLANRLHLLDAFEFAEEAPHRRRTSSITWHFPKGRLRRVHRSSVLRFNDLREDLNLEESSTLDETAASRSQPAVVDLTADGEQDVAATPSKSKGKRPLRVELSEAESSAMGATRKRPRTDIENTFTRDCIDDEELERLLEEGVFS